MKPPRVGGPWCWGKLVTVRSLLWHSALKGSERHVPRGPVLGQVPLGAGLSAGLRTAYCFGVRRDEYLTPGRSPIFSVFLTSSLLARAKRRACATPPNHAADEGEQGWSWEARN